jgi:hypothetical protein
LGEGAAALVLETETAAAARHARVFGEFLGSGCTTEAEGLLAIRTDGDGLAGAIALALDDAEMRPSEVGMIVAHGSATRLSDASEALAIHRVFGAYPPSPRSSGPSGIPCAPGILDSVLAPLALRHGGSPATLRGGDPDSSGAHGSARPQAPCSDVALVLNRGFGGSNTVPSSSEPHPAKPRDGGRGQPSLAAEPAASSRPTLRLTRVQGPGNTTRDPSSRSVNCAVRVLKTPPSSRVRSRGRVHRGGRILDALQRKIDRAVADAIMLLIMAGEEPLGLWHQASV